MRRRLRGVTAVALSLGVAAPAPAGEIVATSFGEKMRIVVMDDDGSDRRVVAQGRNVWLPSWSPNHGRIAFVRSRRRGPNSGRVVVASRSGGDAEALTGPGWAFPAWSPKGRWISASCLAACEAKRGLYLLDPDGTGRRRLTETGRPWVSSWGPGGDRIVFTRGSQADPDIFVKTIGKKGVRRLTNDDFPYGWVSWSPGGKLIAYTRPPAGKPTNPYDVWVMRPDGTGRRQVTKTPRSHDLTVEWAPRGGRLLLTGARGLFTIKRDGTGRQKVPSSRAGDFGGDW